jgi:ABC-type multidrug transport system fused ATPase/permease subunit
MGYVSLSNNQDPTRRMAYDESFAFFESPERVAALASVLALDLFLFLALRKGTWAFLSWSVSFGLTFLCMQLFTTILWYLEKFDRLYVDLTYAVFGLVLLSLGFIGAVACIWSDLAKSKKAQEI